MGNQFTKKEKNQVIDLLIKYENVFTFSMKDLGRCKTMQFFIDLIDETPIYRRKHRLNKHEWELVDEICNSSRNQPKCNQSIYDYMWLVVVCD